MLNILDKSLLLLLPPASCLLPFPQPRVNCKVQDLSIPLLYSPVAVVGEDIRI